MCEFPEVVGSADASSWTQDKARTAAAEKKKSSFPALSQVMEIAACLHLGSDAERMAACKAVAAAGKAAEPYLPKRRSGVGEGGRGYLPKPC